MPFFSQINPVIRILFRSNPWPGEQYRTIWASSRENLFGVFDQVKLKPVCSAKEANWTRGCTGWSMPSVFTYGINRFSHDLAHMVLLLILPVHVISDKDGTVTDLYSTVLHIAYSTQLHQQRYGDSVLLSLVPGSVSTSQALAGIILEDRKCAV